jgi:hypothetical protein
MFTHVVVILQGLDYHRNRTCEKIHLPGQEFDGVGVFNANNSGAH